MKKLSIILLALALAAAMAVPAMAGDISADGSYMLRGRADDTDGATGKQNYFQHELDLNIDVVSGDVKFHWDVELADKDLFDNTGLDYYGDPFPGGDNPKGIWDGFYVQYQATDALSFRAGIYGVSDNNTLLFYSAGNGDGIMGLMYNIEGWKLGAHLSKQVDAHADDEDVTEMIVTAAGDLGPVKASLVYGDRKNDTGSFSSSTHEGNSIYVDAGFDAGPVGITLAYGTVTDDSVAANDGGNIILATFDLSDLVGFDLGLTSITTNEDWTMGAIFGNDYGYGEIEDYDDAPDAQMVGVEAGYKVNDKLGLSGLAVVMNDLGDAGDGPTEVDLTVSYQLADNAKYRVGYASRTGNDTSVDKTRLWHRVDFKF